MGRSFSKLYYWMVVTGLAAFAMRLLLDSRFGKTTITYLLFPFLLSLIIYHFVPRSLRQDVVGRYWNQVVAATAVMLASSLILFEGFLCVLMFLPIFYFGVTLGFIYAVSREKSARRGPTRHGVHLLPLLVLGLSLDGILPFGYDPHRQDATVTEVVTGSIRDLKHNMAKPITFDLPRHWFVSLFPLPERIEAGSLAVGDVHRLYFTYSRWIFTNDKHGSMALRIEEVGADYVRTRVIENTSYLAGYLAIQGTEVRFQAIDERRTAVALTIHYERLLDPGWYFGPIQRFVVEESARYLIHTIIARAE